MRSGGSDYGDFHNSASGEESISDYFKSDAYSKGLKGQYANEYYKGLYGVSGARNSGNHDLANHYFNQHHAAKANRGGSFANENGHDKGSKTSGYHKVLNKDEFKKDHSFYDKADKNGFFNRYGDFDAQKAAKEGSFKKGGHHNSGVSSNEYGAKGQSNKGRFEDASKGYNGARGFDKFSKNYQDYAEKGGKSDGSVKGYSEGDKFDSY